MAFVVIAASPLVKAFLPQFHESLMENPDQLSDFQTPFAFDVPRGTCAFRCEFNKPIELRGKDDREIQMLFNWLTGGTNGVEYPETDCWGVVPFDPKMDMIGRLDEMAQLEALTSDDPKVVAKAQKELKALQADIKLKISGTRLKVREQSETRILRAMRISHNNLVRQWQLNEEMKMGKYPPSVAELMGAHALATEIERKNAKTQKVIERMNGLMQNQIVGG